MRANRQWALFVVLTFTVVIVIVIVGSPRPRDPSVADVLLKRAPAGFVAVPDLSGPLGKDLGRELGLREPPSGKTAIEDPGEGYARTWVDDKGRSIVAIAWKFDTEATAGLALWIELRDAAKIKAKRSRVPGVPGALTFTRVFTKPKSEAHHQVIMRQGAFLFTFVVTGRLTDRQVAHRLASAEHRSAPAGPSDSVPPRASSSFNWGDVLVRVFTSIFVGFLGLALWLAWLTRLVDRLSRLTRWARSLGRSQAIDPLHVPAAAATQRWASSVSRTVEVTPPSRGRLRLKASSSSARSGSITSLRPRGILTSRRPGRVLLLLAVSLVLLTAGLALLVVSNAPAFTDSDPSTRSNVLGVSTVVAWLFFALAAMTYRRARRHAMPPAGEVLRRDPRLPVLYLRSFRDDHLKVRVGGPHRRSWLDSFAHPRMDRFEEVLAWNLWQFGPVIALSLPGQKLPPLGASRAQLSDQGWQHQIERWMRQAQVIVIVLGRTEGLAWEIGRLVDLDMWYKATLVIPPTTESELRRRWAVFRRLAAENGIPTADVPHLTTALVLAPALGPTTVAFSSAQHNELHYHLALEKAVQHLTEYDLEAETQQ
jgi:hypothetical protein